MEPHNNISNPGDIDNSRRRFLGNGFKLAVVGGLLLPLQKALGNGSSFIFHHAENLGHNIRKAVFGNNLVLNSKTKVVHLLTEKIFTHYPEISANNQKIIDLKTWETQVKSPIHFNKEKSGIILELLAFQKLASGITDKNSTAAINTLALAFSPVYKNKDAVILNKYNFRLHELLVQLIALNNSIPVTQKWIKFQAVTGNINYNPGSSISNQLPGRVKWLLTKNNFDERIAYIIKNKNNYMSRLKIRADYYKLS